MRFVLQLALLGVACGIPIAGKKQRAEQKLIVTSEDACPKYVSLTGNDGGRLQVDDAWCEGNCRDRPLCPTDKCTCFTGSGQEEAASADLRKAMVKEKVAAPVAAPEGDARKESCPKFVGRGSSADGNPRLKGSSSEKEDAYCEKNCRKGFCPESTCRCITDVPAEPSDGRNNTVCTRFCFEVSGNSGTCARWSFETASKGSMPQCCIARCPVDFICAMSVCSN